MGTIEADRLTQQTSRGIISDAVLQGWLLRNYMHDEVKQTRCALFFEGLCIGQEYERSLFFFIYFLLLDTASI